MANRDEASFIDIVSCYASTTPLAIKDFFQVKPA